MADLPQQGESLPDLELTTESGEHIGTGELRGQMIVLYFYPKDDTPGCTKEACAFRDRMDEYAKASIQVYGVSLDSPESHREFREKYSLNFPLLTEEGGRASEALGCYARTGRGRNVSPSCSTRKLESPRSTLKSPRIPAPRRSSKTPPRCSL
jgi:peroxiredoxin Q/BCP